jgi:glycosyltransferase involved in cell wall biosynthesis
MIAMAPKLLSQYPSLGIVIVGGGNGLDKLRKQADELGIAEHCILPGSVPYEQVPYFVNAFDVGISFDISTRLTNIGNSSQKVRQYIACGKPVVSGIGGNLFLEQESLGTIVDPDDIEQITNAVNKWLSLPAREKEAHCHKAANYARKHLSINEALKDRLEFWNEKFSEVR